MAIIYVDPENGNDSNSGLSFALSKRTLNSATTSRASGDEVRVKASKSWQVGQAQWSSHRSPPGVTLTSVTTSGSTLIWTRSSHGLQPGDWVKITGFGTPQVNGVFPVTATTSTTFTTPNPSNYSATNVSATTTYYEKVTNCVVELNTPVTQDLLYCGFGTLFNPTLIKTLSTVTVSSVTYGSTSSYMPTVGGYAGQIAYTSTFTTGRVAWYTYSSSLNLSDYRQLSFYIRQTVGTATLTPSHVSLVLCSDTSGNTPVYTFPIPSLGMTNRWCHFVIDCGSYMTTPINSIALYVSRDVGACTFQLNSVIACKGPNDSDLLHQGCLISSKRILGVSPYTKDGWWPIRYITGNYIITTHAHYNYSSVTSTNNTTSSFIGYSFDNRSNTTVKTSAPIYAVEPMDSWTSRLGYAPNSLSALVEQVSSSNITVSGGWNRTDMSTQTTDDITWLSSPNGAGYGLYLTGRSGVNVERIGFSGFYYGFYISGACKNLNFDYCESSGNILSGFYAVSVTTYTNPPGDIKLTYNYHIANNSSGCTHSTASGITYENCVIKSCYTAFSFTTTYRNILKNIHIDNVIGNVISNTTSSFNKGKNIWCENFGVFYYMVSGEVAYNTFNYMYLNNGTRLGTIGNGYSYTSTDIMNMVYLNMSVGVSNSVALRVDSLGGEYNSWGYSTLSGYNARYYGWFRVENDSSISRSGTSLKIIPNGTITPPSRAVPHIYDLASVAVSGGKAVTFSVWLRKNSTIFSPKLVCPPQLPGISDFVSSQPLESLNTWEQFEITVNPTVSGVLDFQIQLDITTDSSLANNNNVWIDDIECSQQ